MKQVLSAVALLHSDEHRIVHRDIKPENLLFRRANKDLSQVVLIDFGLSRFFEPGKRLNTRVGTIYYTAPEVFNKKTHCLSKLLVDNYSGRQYYFVYF